jgi:hypothetical protein
MSISTSNNVEIASLELQSRKYIFPVLYFCFEKYVSFKLNLNLHFFGYDRLGLVRLLYFNP